MNESAVQIGTDRPIFVGGTGRCGTSLLVQSLGKHPDLLMFEESRYFDKEGAIIRALMGHPMDDVLLRDLFGHRRKMLIRSLVRLPVDGVLDEVDSFFTEEILEREVQDAFAGTGNAVEALRVLTDRLFMRPTRAVGASRWVEKTPHTVEQVHHLHSLFPDLLYLHTIRNPLDVASSVFKRPWGPKNAEEFVTYYNGIMHRAEQAHTLLTQAAGNDDHYCVVEFEEYCSRPEETLAGMIRFLQLRVDDAIMETMAGTVNKDHIHSGSWKKDLSEADAELIRAQCFPVHQKWQERARSDAARWARSNGNHQSVDTSPSVPGVPMQDDQPQGKYIAVLTPHRFDPSSAIQTLSKAGEAVLSVHDIKADKLRMDRYSLTTVELEQGIGQHHLPYLEFLDAELNRHQAVVDWDGWAPDLIPGLHRAFPVDSCVYLVNNGINEVNTVSEMLSAGNDTAHTMDLLYRARWRLAGNDPAQWRNLGNFEKACFAWGWYAGKKLELTAALGADRVHAMTLESLNNQEEAARFLSTLTPDTQLPIDGFKGYEPDDAVAAWASWTDDQKNLFRQWCGPTMETWGYAIPNGQHPAQQERVEETKISVQPEPEPLPARKEVIQILDALNQQVHAGHWQPAMQITKQLRQVELLAGEWEALRSIAASLFRLRPVGPYPYWRFCLPEVLPEPAQITMLRKELWQLFRKHPEEAKFVVNWWHDLKLNLQLAADSGRCFYTSETLEPNEFAFLDRVLQPGMILLDIGGNEGLFSMFAARKVGTSGAVHAFEPSSREQQAFKANMTLNNLSQVHLHEVALGDTPGTIELNIAGFEHMGHNTVGSKFYYDSVKADHVEEVQVMRLDDVVREQGIKRVDMIKIDVEGAEVMALRGGRETIERFHPLILSEYQNGSLQLAGSSIQEYVQLLEELGYELYEFDEETGLPERCPKAPERDTNIIAVPQGKSLEDYYRRQSAPEAQPVLVPVVTEADPEKEAAEAVWNLPYQPRKYLPLTDSYKPLLEQLLRIWKIDGSLPRKADGKRVLVASLHGSGGRIPAMTQDMIMAAALAKRGANVKFLVCDGLMTGCVLRTLKEDGEPGGWMNRCMSCYGQSKSLVESMGFSAIALGDYVSIPKRQELRRMADTLPLDHVTDITYMDMPVGEMAYSSTERFTMGKLNNTNPEYEQYLREYLYTSLVMTEAYNAVVTILKPDHILADHPCYADWESLLLMAGRENIPITIWHAYYIKQSYLFRTCAPGERGIMWYYPRDEEWANIKDRTLSPLQQKRLDQYYHNFIHRKNVRMLSHDPKLPDQEALRRKYNLPPDRPVWGIFPHLNWDAAVLGGEKMAHTTATEWLVETLRIIQEVKDVTWVIKIHPVEFRTKTEYGNMHLIRQHMPEIPDHVRIIPGEDSVNTFGLLGVLDGVITILGTIGLDATSYGHIPAIVSAEVHYGCRGFTNDCLTREQYENALRDVVNIKLSPEQYTIARNYAYNFLVERLIPLNYFTPDARVSLLNLKSLDDLDPGKDPYLDFVCDRMLNGGGFSMPEDMIKKSPFMR